MGFFNLVPGNTTFLLGVVAFVGVDLEGVFLFVKAGALLNMALERGEGTSALGVALVGVFTG